MAEVGPHIDTSRDGSRSIVEVYPAAALHCWGLPARGYGGNGYTERLSSIVDLLKHAAPWLDLGDPE